MDRNGPLIGTKNSAFRRKMNVMQRSTSVIDQPYAYPYDMQNFNPPQMMYASSANVSVPPPDQNQMPLQFPEKPPSVTSQMSTRSCKKKSKKKHSSMHGNHMSNQTPYGFIPPGVYHPWFDSVYWQSGWNPYYGWAYSNMHQQPETLTDNLAARGSLPVDTKEEKSVVADSIRSWGSVESLNEATRVNVSSNDENKEVQEVQNLNELCLFTSPHTKVHFSNNDQMTMTFDYNPAKSEPLLVQISDVNLSTVNFNEDVLMLMNRHVGPLNRTTVSPYQVLQVCETRLVQSQISSTKHECEKSVLWRFFCDLIFKKGESNFDMWHALLNLNQSNSFEQAELSNSVNLQSQSKASNDQLVSLLACSTNVNSAMQYAADEQNWIHALFLSAFADGEERMKILNRFVTCMDPCHPLTTYYHMILGNLPTAVMNPSCLSNGRWRGHLGVILSLQNVASKELVNRCFYHLCNSLVKSGDIIAYHICRLMFYQAFDPFEGDSRPGKLTLIGIELTDSRPPEELLLDPDVLTAFEMTEIYEYIKDGVIPTLIPFKIAFAVNLYKAEIYEKCWDYCEHISKLIITFSNGRFPLDVNFETLSTLIDVSYKAKMFSTQWRYKRNSAPVWLQQIVEMIKPPLKSCLLSFDTSSSYYPYSWSKLNEYRKNKNVTKHERKETDEIENQIIPQSFLGEADLAYNSTCMQSPATQHSMDLNQQKVEYSNEDIEASYFQERQRTLSNVTESATNFDYLGAQQNVNDFNQVHQAPNYYEVQPKAECYDEYSQQYYYRQSINTQHEEPTNLQSASYLIQTTLQSNVPTMSTTLQPTASTMPTALPSDVPMMPTNFQSAVPASMTVQSGTPLMPTTLQPATPVSQTTLQFDNSVENHVQPPSNFTNDLQHYHQQMGDNIQKAEGMQPQVPINIDVQYSQMENNLQSIDSTADKSYESKKALNEKQDESSNPERSKNSTKQNSSELTTAKRQNSPSKPSIFHRVLKGIFKAPNQVHLPDDTNPTIIYDEAKGRWVNLEEEDETGNKPVLPPCVTASAEAQQEFTPYAYVTPGSRFGYVNAWNKFNNTNTPQQENQTLMPIKSNNSMNDAPPGNFFIPC